MSNFPIHNIDTAPEGSRAVLASAENAMGSIPNLLGTFAGSPAMLKAYMTLSELQDQETAFDETQRQVLFLSVSNVNNCGYCVAAHSTIASMKKVPADVVAAVRAGTSLPTPELEALRSFALAVVEQRGWVGGAPLEAFLAAGYTSRHALEVVLAVAFKTISNYTNHMASIPLDQAFASNAWSPDPATASA